MTWPKKHFFEGYTWFKCNNLVLAQGMTLTFYTSLEKWFKLIVRSLGGYFLTYMKKLVGGFFTLPPHPE